MPMINIIPAIVWSIPFHQKLFPNAGWWLTFGLCAVFVIAYVALSYIPWVVIAPGNSFCDYLFRFVLGIR